MTHDTNKSDGWLIRLLDGIISLPEATTNSEFSGILRKIFDHTSEIVTDPHNPIFSSVTGLYAHLQEEGYTEADFEEGKHPGIDYMVHRIFSEQDPNYRRISKYLEDSFLTAIQIANKDIRLLYLVNQDGEFRYNHGTLIQEAMPETGFLKYGQIYTPDGKVTAFLESQTRLMIQQALDLIQNGHDENQALPGVTFRTDDALEQRILQCFFITTIMRSQKEIYLTLYNETFRYANKILTRTPLPTHVTTYSGEISLGDEIVQAWT